MSTQEANRTLARMLDDTKKFIEAELCLNV